MDIQIWHVTAVVLVIAVVALVGYVVRGVVRGLRGDRR